MTSGSGAHLVTAPDVPAVPEREGVWVCHSYDMGPTGVRVFETEIEALRAAQQGGYFQHVVFLPFGDELK